MKEKTKVIITNIKDLPGYGEKGYNPEQIISIGNSTTGDQEQQNGNQSQGDDKSKGK